MLTEEGRGDGEEGRSRRAKMEEKGGERSAGVELAADVRCRG